MKAEIFNDTGLRKKLYEFFHPRDLFTPKILSAEMDGNVLSITCNNSDTGTYRLWDVFRDDYKIRIERAKDVDEKGRPLIRIENTRIGNKFKVDVFDYARDGMSYLSHETVSVVE
jgi:hypothetical protein